MGRYIKITFLFIKYKFKSMASYRMSFIFNAFSQFLSYAIDFAVMWIMITAFGTINGWTRYEIMLLYGMSLASYALAGFFFFNVGELPQAIQSGSFDDYMVKPVSVLPYIVANGFNTGYVSHLSLSIIMIVMSFFYLGITLSIAEIAFFILCLITGALIYGAMFIFSVVPAFFFINNSAIRMFIFRFREYTYYPLSIFPRAIQIIMIFIIPYGFINFYPSQYFLNKTDFIFFNPVVTGVAPVLAVSFFTLSVILFNFGIKNYKSSGS